MKIFLSNFYKKALSGEGPTWKKGLIAEAVNL